MYDTHLFMYMLASILSIVGYILTLVYLALYLTKLNYASTRHIWWLLGLNILPIFAGYGRLYFITALVGAGLQAGVATYRILVLKREKSPVAIAPNSSQPSQNVSPPVQNFL